MEPVFNQEQIVINHANRTVITTSNLQNNSKQTTTKQPVITWNDESEYPMLDELSRIAKVRTIGFFLL
jgi:hypothetical protein